MAAFLTMFSQAAETQKRPNHLIGERSPYLLQHAYNPVDWHPWGEEAFAKARRENKPIFLSIGYSTCHWCHVMERESYSDARVAAALNADFVSVKVDREERPDVDNVYMAAAQAAGWGGGWPLNLWLTPDLKPIFGGTYFPPDSRGGSTGLIEISGKISTLWKDRESEVRAGAGELAGALRKYAQADAGSAALDPALLEGEYKTLLSGYDADRGGFGGQFKFPMPANQDFLLRYYARTKERKALDMVVRTLQAMADGGIHDQLGGGFHRYSTDREWRVPHFEKMLYDNAQLAVNCVEAYQAAKDHELSRVARGILDYVRRDMTAPEGGFYSAEDADSLPPASPADGELREGAFYLWRKADILAVLGPDAGETFSARYGVEPRGNIERDARGEFGGLNVLYAAQSATETARQVHKQEVDTRKILEEARRRLLAVRRGRSRPRRDDKIVASWNGLMISAFAKSAWTFDDPQDLQAAEGAARFVRTRLYDAKTGRLSRYWRDGERRGAGLADDYAFLTQGLLDLYAASFDTVWLEWAVRLTETQQALFSDVERGGLYLDSEEAGRGLLVRPKADSDNAEPAASSVAALNLLRLAQFTGRKDFREAAEKTLSSFARQMKERPASLPKMLTAAALALDEPGQIVIAGDPRAPDTRLLLKEARSRFLPEQVVMVLGDGKDRRAIVGRLPYLEGAVRIRGRAAAYVCVERACRLPTTDPARLGAILDENRVPRP